MRVRLGDWRRAAVAVLFYVMPEVARAGNSALADYDQRRLTMTHALWEAQGPSRIFGVDPRGRTLAVELAEKVLVPKTIVALDGLRARAVHELNIGHDAEAQSLLQSATETLEREEKCYTAWYGYWQKVDPLAINRKLWIDVLEHLPPEMASVTASRSRVTVAEATLVGALNADSAASADCGDMALGELVARLESVYGDERGKLVADLAKQELRAGHPLAGRDRVEPCPAAAAKTSGKEHAAFDLLPNLQDFYPLSAQSIDVQGSVLIRAHIDTAGCAQRLEIVQGSGVPQLDTAALEFSEHARFLAAESGGRSVASEKVFKVTFVLR